MKKIKLLMPLLGVAATAGAVLPVVTSCANGGGQEEAKVKITAPKIDEPIVAKDKEDANGVNHLYAEITGFTVEGAEVKDLKINLATDAYIWIDEVTAKIEEDKTNAGNGFKITLDMVDEEFLQPAGEYRLFFEITKGEDIVFTSSDIFVSVKENFDITKVDKTTSPLYDYYAMFTGFELKHINLEAGIYSTRFFAYASPEAPVDSAIRLRVSEIDYETGTIIFYIPEAWTSDTTFYLQVERGYSSSSQWHPVQVVLDRTSSDQSSGWQIDFK